MSNSHISLDILKCKLLFEVLSVKKALSRIDTGGFDLRYSQLQREYIR